MEFVIIMLLLICLVPSMPYILILKKINTDSLHGRYHKLRYRELLLFTMMPIEGLICYHLLDDFEIEKPQFDWTYYLSVISVPIIVAVYLISRKNKYKMTMKQRIISIVLLIYGIFLCICFGIRFIEIGMMGLMVVLTPLIFYILLALPYYALMPVMMLLINEIYCIIKFNTKKN